MVATALCADSAVASAPQGRVTPSRSLAARIATSFRQAVPSVQTQLRPARTPESATSYPLPIRQTASGVRSQFSPFQFRLPPPAAR